MQLSIGLSLCAGSNGAAGVNAQLAALLSTALIPTRDGVLTTVSSATVDPITGAAVLANTPNGRTLNVGGYSFPGAALLAQRATSGLYGAATASVRLASNSTAVGDYPIQRTTVEDGTAGQHNAETASVALSTGVNYATSCYVKRGNGSRNITMQLTDKSANGGGISVDLSTGGVTPSAFGGASIVRSSARLLASGWWFIQFTATSSAWAANVTLQFVMVNGVSASYTGDGTSSLIISGYQVEQGEYATTPLNWDGGAVSRLATSLSWAQSLSLTAGTVWSLTLPYGWSDTFGPAAGRLYDANATGGMQHNTVAQTYSAYRTDALAAANLATSAAAPASAGTAKSVVHRWDATSNRIRVNGADVSSAAPTLPFAAGTPLFLGNRAALDASIDAWEATILFPSALSNADADLLTSYSSIV